MYNVFANSAINGSPSIGRSGIRLLTPGSSVTVTRIRTVTESEML